MSIPEPWVLAVDRTQWDVGTTTVNMLTLGVVHEDDERMELMERFYELFPDVQVRCLTPDREFVGTGWLSYLLLASDWKLKTPFRLRI